jgi:hypothetical protein
VDGFVFWQIEERKLSTVRASFSDSSNWQESDCNTYEDVQSMDADDFFSKSIPRMGRQQWSGET